MEGKVAAVTGAANGIGLAIASRFVAEGAKVVLNDLNAEALKQAAAELKMPFEAGDASLKADADRLVARTVEEFGRIDIMVSNAGVTNKPAEFVDLDEEEFDRVLRINLKSQFLTGQAAARQMIAQGGGGVIINMSSVNSRLAIPTMTPYAVSKAGSTQLTNVMAISLGGHGIRVNAIGPCSATRNRAGACCRGRRSAASASRRRWPASPCSSPPMTVPTSPARPSIPMAVAWG
jgi:NAD(P)-dependent dehydrogenase (short-subunit alcohol dehydrogenase family)